MNKPDAKGKYSNANCFIAEFLTGEPHAAVGRVLMVAIVVGNFWSFLARTLEEKHIKENK